MSRRRAAIKREVLPDAKYKDKIITQFMNKVMLDGKKSKAEKIVYGAFEIINNKTKNDPLKFFHESIDKVKPSLEVRSRRVGGATYQVPVAVKPLIAQTLAMKWIIENAKSRSEKTMREKIAGELMDAFNNKGKSAKKREETNKMAEANRAFAHFKW